MEVTRTLAKFIVEHRYTDIPEKVRHEAAVITSYSIHYTKLYDQSVLLTRY